MMYKEMYMMHSVAFLFTNDLLTTISSTLILLGISNDTEC